MHYPDAGYSRAPTSARARVRWQLDHAWDCATGCGGPVYVCGTGQRHGEYKYRDVVNTIIAAWEARLSRRGAYSGRFDNHCRITHLSSSMALLGRTSTAIKPFP